MGERVPEVSKCCSSNSYVLVECKKLTEVYHGFCLRARCSLTTKILLHFTVLSNDGEGEDITNSNSKCQLYIDKTITIAN
ncbi:hypothetical protein TSUD_35570 [Trifolium subterraneum]|uniref:Uncharacterized protein n=1 Tax=Trifolium subterraneum TaxID=3900 RepID=A0A2Z6N403_TRISU|nr:hypothetical protein TSUD_35570 [Trifolium subterraneum]